MRDNFKNVAYFEKFIKEDSQRIKKFTEKLDKGQVKEDRILSVKSLIHDLKLGILIAQYSKGDSLCVLKQDFCTLLDTWNEVWEPDFYNKSLKIISLTVLFNVRSNYIDEIRKMLEKSNTEDWLLDYLLNAQAEEKKVQSDKLIFPDSFLTLKDVVMKEKKVDLLTKYLKHGWYREDCGCFEAHKSKQNAYYGYWSFEAGAIAKILNIDDSSLKNLQYYPYDLVHYVN